MHKIISSTDHKYIGDYIVIEITPIRFKDGVLFYPDKIFKVSEDTWRLYNASYVIDCKKEI